MKSLRPLRDAVPCELVMADTGSDDGSREAAEKYADILFDFPWINDFAAARNAVVDRCSGEWYLSIDADEWLDENITQLVDFLTHRERWKHPLCGVMLRDYFTPELDEYNDFLAIRMALMSTGARFVGAIHELWNLPPSIYGLGKTLLHHDGYVKHTPQWSAEKNQRNMKLLREQLAKKPEDLRILLECLESSQGDPGYGSYIYRSVETLKRRPPLYAYYAPPILRYALLWAAGQDLPELEEWQAWALDEFSDSPYINIDGAYALFAYNAGLERYDQAISMGERYLRALADYRAGRIDHSSLIFGSFCMALQSREEGARVILANAYFQKNQVERARELLLSLNLEQLRPETVRSYLGVMMNLHTQGDENLSFVLADFWEKNGPGKKQGAACRQAMVGAAQTAFSPASWAAEDQRGCRRHAWSLFLPLAGKCEVGNAARILAAGTAEEAREALLAVEDWTALPVSALVHAVENGVEFPLPERTLNVEVLDNLAARLTAEPTLLERVLERVVEEVETPQTIAWGDRLALASVQARQWGDEARDLELARIFVDLEKKFLPLCYTANAPLFVLPPLHRFGYFCARAFAALDSGDAEGYVRGLRQGLESCESMKPMVELLLNQTPALQAPPVDPELLELAEKVRTMLAAYPADDPAVAALKASPAYQRVAYFIEGGDGI